MTLSVCIIARDEAAGIAACLKSIQAVADEVILVDTGSADDTPRIAAEMGARVIQHAWKDDFAEARNRSLKEAKSDWILVIDADEVLEHGSAVHLPGLLAMDSAEAYTLVQRSLMPETEMCRYQDLDLVRLFRNRKSYRYEGAIHEQVTPSILRAGGTVRRSGLILRHDGYARPTAQGGVCRAERNLAILEKAVAEQPGDAYLAFQIGATQKALGNAAEAKKHLQDAVALGADELGADVRSTLFMKLAQLELAEENHAAAIDAAARAIQADPKNLVATMVQALALCYTGRIGDAVVPLRNALSSPACSDSMRSQIQLLLGQIAA